jgi:hypothetical protein
LVECWPNTDLKSLRDVFSVSQPNNIIKDLFFLTQAGAGMMPAAAVFDATLTTGIYML